MAKKKVFEIAKELDKTSKEIVAFLQNKGVEVKNHMSAVEENVADMIKKEFGAGKSVVKQEISAKETGEKAAVKEEPVKTAAKAETSVAADASVKTDGGKKDAAKTEEAPVKKKKNIIFVSNPQHSKMPGSQIPRVAKPAQRPQTQAGTRTPEGKPTAPKAVTAEANNTIDAGSVQTQGVPQAQEQAGSVQGGQTTQGQTGSSQGSQRLQGQGGYNQGNQRPQGQGGYNQGSQRPQGQGGYNQGSQRPQGQGGYNQGSQRPQGQGGYNQGSQRPQGQGGYNQGGQRPQGQNTYNNGQRQGGYNSGERRQGSYSQGQGGQRPQGQGSYNRNGQTQSSYQGQRDGNRPYQNRQGGGTYAGGNRPYNNSQGGRPGDGRQNPNFRKPQQAKGFGGDTPIKDEKHRDDNKRRFNQQERDKRSKKDLIYAEDGLDVKGKLKPGRFIKPEKKQEEAIEEIKVITLPESLTIRELAEKMKLQPSAIVKKLFLQGQIVTVNQEITYEKAEEIAIEYDIICEKEVKIDVIEELLKEDEENEVEMESRPPVICVMGHVDHGKTSLLDAIRKTNVTDREAGGITQHIGAYTVTIDDRKITFLDTPGHEAFTSMRMRGANSTDIAILVVAADDGVMPQTVEAINHAKAAGIEIIVAVNKVDKPGANIERVKQELTEYELISEDWGGSTVFVPVSAKSGEGIPQLLEMILLTSDVLELKANPDRMARGLVIEAELDKGRGPVATILVQKGTLHVGDFISAGASHGKVRAMIDDKGRRVKEAGPSTPVEILGLNDVPNAGEIFIAHDNDKEAKSFAETFVAQNKEKLLEDTKAKISLDDLFSQIQAGNLKELNLIIKADVQGSVEAVKQSMLKLSNEEVVVKVIHSGVGAINESDVSLASASAAIIIGFNVRPDVQAKATAEREAVDLRLYKVIYQAIEDVEAAMKGMLDPVYEEKVIGHAEVRQIFKASAIGNIAGSYVLDGKFERECKVRISREGEQIFEGKLQSLKRFKDDVKEVKAGFECGLVFEDFDQMQELDVVEAYIMVEVPR